MYDQEAVNPYLSIQDPSKKTIERRLVRMFENQSVVPAFPKYALRLFHLLEDDAASIEDFEKVISMDAGLSTRTLKIAGSSAYAAYPIDNIQQAVLIVGINQLRRIAMSVVMMKALTVFNANTNWRYWWLHNILAARLTEHIAGSFAQTSGREYLTGLLHDVGKLIIQHWFPEESAKITLLSEQRRCNYTLIEKEVLGIDHARIGAALCYSLKLNDQIIKAILFHHEPWNANAASSESGNELLAAFVALANRYANHVAPEFPGKYEGPVEQSAEWTFLERLLPARKLKFDIDDEIKTAREEMAALFE